MVRHQRSRGERAGDAAAQSFQAMVRGARDRKSDESYPLWPAAAGQAAYGAQGQQGRALAHGHPPAHAIGRAACRERLSQHMSISVVAASLTKKHLYYSKLIRQSISSHHLHLSTAHDSTNTCINCFR